MNAQFHEALQAAGAHEWRKSRGAFFDSLCGTLNHIMVADLWWLRRFAGHSDRYTSLDKLDDFPRPTALNEVLYPALSDWYRARWCLDEVIEQWLASDTEEADFERPLTYRNSKGEASTRPFGELVAHFFNHQTHHRGQASTLLSQRGVDVGVTDFLADIPKEGKASFKQEG